MFDTVNAGVSVPYASTKKTVIVHQSDQAHASKLRAYLRSRPELALQRSETALKAALKTDHCALQKNARGIVLGVSLALPQIYFSRAVSWQSVFTAIEIVLHHRGGLEGREFLTDSILSGQVPLLRQKYQDVPIYMVVRRAHGYAGFLDAHGWEPFDEPDEDMIRSREHTGARCCPDDLWFKLPSAPPCPRRTT